MTELGDNRIVQGLDLGMGYCCICLWLALLISVLALRMVGAGSRFYVTVPPQLVCGICHFWSGEHTR